VRQHCNASNPGGCNGFTFRGGETAAPTRLGSWAAEAAEREPWLHGYWAYDFSDAYWPMRAAVDAGDGR
jgi:hypothetical protein